MSFFRTRWEKNWPEIHAAARGSFPSFVFSADPVAPSGLPAFWYHSVEGPELEADLRFLARNGYTALDGETVLAHLDGGTPMPDRSVVLCFDDGAVNLYRVAFPLLRAYRQRALAFVCPAFSSTDPSLSVELKRTCTWAELREMDRSGWIDVQSHTHEHRYVPRWPEPAELTDVDPRFWPHSEAPLPMRDDFRLARETLERELDKEVRHLAFPRHDGTAEAVLAAHAVGYRCFWWGVQPRPLDELSGPLGHHVPRVSGEFLRRLPGDARVSLSRIFGRRYLRAFRNLLGPPARRPGGG